MKKPRYYPWEAIDFSRWIGICELSDGKQWYECYWLKLPCYADRLVYFRDRYEWCQLVLFWHGRDGLSWFWTPAP